VGGRNVLLFLLYLLSPSTILLRLFFLSLSKEYYCGELILGYIDNPTEAEITFMTIGVISAAAGPKVWSTKMFDVGDTEINVYKFIILLSILGMFSTVGRK
jgi:hypothetical protein